MTTSRLTVVAAAVITLVCVVGIIALAVLGIPIPDVLQGIAFTALGVLVGGGVRQGTAPAPR